MGLLKLWFVISCIIGAQQRYQNNRLHFKYCQVLAFMLSKTREIHNNLEQPQVLTILNFKISLVTILRLYQQKVLIQMTKCSQIKMESGYALICMFFTLSGLNATYKTPMYEMPLIYVFGVFGLGRAFFVLGFRAMAFCHWRFVPRSSFTLFYCKFWRGQHISLTIQEGSLIANYYPAKTATRSKQPH